LMDINGVEIKKYSYKFNYLDDNYVPSKMRERWYEKP